MRAVPPVPVSRLRWLHTCADRLRARAGWKRALSAFAYGALASLAFAPTDVAPVLWVCFPALIFLVQGTKNWRGAFAAGWCFAFGFFTFDLYWIAASMFVDLHRFWWAVPLAVAGLPAFFALYYGIAAALARRLGLQGLTGAVSFALLWFLADYARGHLFTGFPWNIEGYAWAEILPVAQIVSMTGVYGLTLLTLLGACLPAALAEQPLRKSARESFLFSLVVLAGLTVWGSARLETATAAMVPGVRLRLVQPDIAESMKWDPARAARHFERMLKLSAEPAAQKPNFIVWPETAAVYPLEDDALHRQEVAALAPPGGAIITGTLRRDFDAVGNPHYYNSLVAVDHAARIIAVYDKSHLVPFGEYVPYRKYLPIRPVAALGLDFSAGPGPRTLRIPHLPPFSPLICYEAIFSETAVDPHDRPQFILNITNDGWYGDTTGPYQHFTIASMRAIEEGMPLVRAANTGISGVVDAYGRVRARLGLGKEGVIDSGLPVALPRPTFFGQYGEKPLWVFFIGLLVLVVAAKIRSAAMRK